MHNTDPDTPRFPTLPPAKAQRLLEWEADLLSGKVFAQASSSLLSITGYVAPMTCFDWADGLAVMARMGRASDGMADLASAALALIPNRYATGPEAVARMFDRVAARVEKGHDDVLARSGPEPIRPSEALRPFTARELLLALLYLNEAEAAMARMSVPSIGWTAALLMDEVGLSRTAGSLKALGLKATARNAR